MTEPIDEHFVSRVQQLAAAPPGTAAPGAETEVDAAEVLALFDAQVQSRHLDLAARWLQAEQAGYYTIGSAGHEANAALGQLTRVDDPALLHYRSGGFYAARAARLRREDPAAATDPVRDVLLSLVCAAADPMSGGRHKVFGHPRLHIVPQTSTIASHLPRAVGLAHALDNRDPAAPAPPWPADAVVVCSLGDASVNHSTAQGALNAAAYLRHQGRGVPVLFVVEDNGLGISTRTAPGWVERALRRLPGVGYHRAGDPDPGRLLPAVRAAVEEVRRTRSPAVLHLDTVRFMGHAGSDVELGYRTAAEIAADHARDPLLATAGYLVRHGIRTTGQVLQRYEEVRAAVAEQARAVTGEPHLADRAEVTRALAVATGSGGDLGPAPDRAAVWAGRPPEDQGRLTLAQAVNATLTDLMATRPEALVLGEDVAVKGGVYGVTRGLHRRFGGARVLDTLLDEQTVLGLALGAALTGLLPIPEIQYLAYLHNAEDQLRGEAASLQFFSAGRYRNPMVVRIAGLAYQRGFGGHFHNDNSVAVLRDVPGLVLCVPSHPADAPALLRGCVALAEREGRVCVYLEPIALYHRRDLYDDGDGLWTARYPPPEADEPARPGTTARHGDGGDLLLVTFGNGVPMSLRAARRLAAEGVGCTVLDLRWLVPLPETELAAVAAGFDRVLVVDETRASGGVGEGVVAALVAAGHRGRLGRVSSADSYVPLGPAARHVLLGEDEVVRAGRALVG